MKPVAAIVAASFAIATVTLTITPASHDFGDQGVHIGGNSKTFYVTLPTGAGAHDTLDAQILGANAGEFSVDRGTVGMQPGSYQSTCTNKWRTGACGYVVEFRPTSKGVKTATLIVEDTRGNRGTAALKGNGVHNCQPYLVPCNWAHLYSGEFTIQKVDSTVVSLDSKMRETTTIDVTITDGVARCDVVESGVTETYDGGKITSRTTSQGKISDAGLFALEFERSSGTLVYKMSFVCPSARVTATTIDYREGTTTTETYPSEPADWRHAALVADYQPATAIAMIALKGRQLDLRTPMGDDVGGYVSIKWELLRQ